MRHCLLFIYSFTIKRYNKKTQILKITTEMYLSYKRVKIHQANLLCMMNFKINISRTIAHQQRRIQGGGSEPIAPSPIYRVSQKHGNSVTNWISSLLWISIVIPNFKSHNIIMSGRVYFIKRVKDCKYVYIMSPQDEQWRRTSLLCLYTVIFLFYYNRMQSKHKQTKCEHSRRNSCRLQLSQELSLY